MSITFAAYLRTSTDDNQSPEDSRRWQLSVAEQLVAPAGGRIVAIYHDVDVSRSRPWPRRPEATRLLEDVADPSRGWDALVVGEPQRAFSGAQFQLVFPVLSHYGVDLWVPEIGGRVDPDSDAHDLVMNLFGGLSKAERRRIQIRTRASMMSLATDGRWLGGRPNYGCRLVDTGLPHPNRSKASAGAQLRTLQPDPETASVVGRIFEMYDDGTGFRSIARVLEGEGIPSPGEVGPTRHPRSAGVWGGSVVRAILTNPRYLGRQVAGRQRRHDELVDARDPALGTTSRQRWQEPDTWSWSEQECWPPLVAEDLWHRVNARIKNTRGTQRRRPRSEPGRYVLAGAVRCAQCGKSMFGAMGKGKPYYRCSATRPDYAAPAVAGHPPTYSVREERILDALDDWLATLTDGNASTRRSPRCSPPTARVIPSRPRSPGPAASRASSGSSSIACSPRSAPAWIPIWRPPKRAASRPRSPARTPSSIVGSARPIAPARSSRPTSAAPSSTPAGSSVCSQAPTAPSGPRSTPPSASD